MKDNLMETCTFSRTVFEGRVVTLKVDDVSLCDGAVSQREYIEHRGGAAVLAVDSSRYVYLVRQYRYPYGEEMLEIPAGKLEKGEDPEKAAIRELSEETGLVTDKLIKLGIIYPSPGYTNEKLHIYLATKFKQDMAHPDVDERLCTVRIKFDDALDMVRSGEIKDAKTCYAILRYLTGDNG